MPGATPAPFRVVVYCACGLVAAIVLFTGASGLTHATMPARIATAVAVGATTWALGRVPDSWFADVPRAFKVAFVAGMLVLLAQLAWLTLFILDPTRELWRDGLLRPWNPRHSCVSAYWTAAEKATSVPDLYLESVYRPPTPPGATRQPNLGPFFVDVYEYPPTFLPLPRLLARATGDFWGFRQLWFALNLGGVAVGLIAIALRLDKALGSHTVWLTPWALAAPSVIGTLQAGNVQLLFIVGTAVAMLLFERRRPVLGGLLLGYAIVSKLYPGVFVLYLLLRRDWRAVAWTAATSVALTLVTLVDVGWTPMAAFLDHLPKILSGEAFPGLLRPNGIAINESIPGLVFKLGLLGVPGMGFPAARVVGWLYTVVLVVALVRFASGRGDPRLEPLVWVAILIQATLRSPFLPGYGAFPSLWLVTLLAGVFRARPSAPLLAAASWLTLAFHIGQNSSVPWSGVITLVHTVLAVVLAFSVVPRVVEAPGK